MESHVYSELKNLAGRGLTTVKDEAEGGRQRSVCAITEQGRRGLRDWLSEPGRR